MFVSLEAKATRSLTSSFKNLILIMAEPCYTTKTTYDRKTIIFRIFLVIVHLIFGSLVFHYLEKDEASKKIATFRDDYNKTMTRILSRFVANATEMKMIMAEIQQSFLQEIFPKEWDIFGGFNISIQAITTLG